MSVSTNVCHYECLSVQMSFSTNVCWHEYLSVRTSVQTSIGMLTLPLPLAFVRQSERIDRQRRPYERVQIECSVQMLKDQYFSMYDVCIFFLFFFFRSK